MFGSDNKFSVYPAALCISARVFQVAASGCSSAVLRMCLQGETSLVQQWPLPGLIHAVSTGLRPACRGKGLIVMLGADLWLTGLSGAQSVGHSTNLRYPCPWWLLRKDRLTGWLTYFLIDQMDERLIQWWRSGGVCGWPTQCLMGNVERTVKPKRVCLFSSFLHSTPAFSWRNSAWKPCYIWSLSVDLTLYNSSHSLVPLCESMISGDCSVFEGMQWSSGSPTSYWCRL